MPPPSPLCMQLLQSVVLCTQKECVLHKALGSRGRAEPGAAGGRVESATKAQQRRCSRPRWSPHVCAGAAAALVPPVVPQCRAWGLGEGGTGPACTAADSYLTQARAAQLSPKSCKCEVCKWAPLPSLSLGSTQAARREPPSRRPPRPALGHLAAEGGWQRRRPGGA